jgi:hypothetical protein
MRASGKVNFVALLMLLAIGGGVYLVAIYSGVYLDNLDVKQQMKAGFNDWGVKNEATIRTQLLRKLNDKELGWHREEDEYGEEHVRPGLGITDEQLVIEADTVSRQLSMRLEYDREVQFKPSKKRKIVHFVVDVSGPFPH